MARGIVSGEHLDEFKEGVNRRFDAVDQRFDAVDRRFDAVDASPPRRSAGPLRRGVERVDNDLRELRQTMAQGSFVLAGIQATTTVTLAAGLIAL